MAVKIIIADTNAVSLQFKPSEVRAVISILKVILDQVEIDYIRQAVNELEGRIRPRLTLVSHFHYCNQCACEIDDRVGDNFIHIVTEEKDIYVHRNCPPLKPETDRDR